ncbi:MAG: hypothetical protein ACMG6E_08300 [Candidatus Roizmanbacteria bacterium]
MKMVKYGRAGRYCNEATFKKVEQVVETHAFRKSQEYQNAKE